MSKFSFILLTIILSMMVISIKCGLIDITFGVAAYLFVLTASWGIYAAWGLTNIFKEFK